MEKLLIIIGVLVVLVNIITEVVKSLCDKFKSSKVINIFVLIISLVMTIIAYFFYAHFEGIVIDAYGIIASIIVSFMVAYSAMFGFDKLLVYIEPYIKGE